MFKLGILILFLPFIFLCLVRCLLGINIFDNPDFWYAYMTYFGTAFLSIVAVWQNKKAQVVNEKLTKENNDLQKIMSQSLTPAVTIDFIETKPMKFEVSSVQDFPKREQCSIIRMYKGNDVENIFQQVIVNVDAENQPFSKKEVILKIKNISDSFIRHISIDDIRIVGYKDYFDSIVCKNTEKGIGFGGLLRPNDTLDIKVLFYTNDTTKTQLWDDSAAGISFILYLTNISMYDIEFPEYIEIQVTNDGYQRITYGTRTLQ